MTFKISLQKIYSTTTGSHFMSFSSLFSFVLASVRREKARVQRAKELEHSLEEISMMKQGNILQKQVEDFDYRWNDVSEKWTELSRMAGLL